MGPLLLGRAWARPGAPGQEPDSGPWALVGRPVLLGQAQGQTQMYISRAGQTTPREGPAKAHLGGAHLGEASRTPTSVGQASRGSVIATAAHGQNVTRPTESRRSMLAESSNASEQQAA